jgi:hypothetical protein
MRCYSIGKNERTIATLQKCIHNHLLFTDQVQDYKVAKNGTALLQTDSM